LKPGEEEPDRRKRMAVVTMKELLEAGVHFGHQTRRWNPKMKPYIFTERNDIYIIDLQKTLVMIGTAYAAIRDAVSDGGTLLFVGTKKQAQEAVLEHAYRSGMPYVNNRWLGGTLTNFTTIHSRVMYLDELERRDREGELDTLPKKEALHIRRQIEKLKRNLEGIRTMHRLPSMIFVIDPRKEKIAVAEARKLGNAIRAANLLCRVVADAVLEGNTIREAKLGEQMAEGAAEAAGQAALLSAAVPAYSASPDDIAGPDMSPGASEAEAAPEETQESSEPGAGGEGAVEATEGGS